MPIVITIPKQELYDDQKEKFVYIDKDYEVPLEHNLLSISKWESKWHKRYFDNNGQRTSIELLDYIKCMSIKQSIPDIVFYAFTEDDINRIAEYINDTSTATTIRQSMLDNSPSNEQLSSELIYYYMFKLNIPKECEKWHINRLLVLLEIFMIKDGKENKNLSRSELIARNKAINAKNKAKFKSKG